MDWCRCCCCCVTVSWSDKRERVGASGLPLRMDELTVVVVLDSVAGDEAIGLIVVSGGGRGGGAGGGAPAGVASVGGFNAGGAGGAVIDVEVPPPLAPLVLASSAFNSGSEPIAFLSPELLFSSPVDAFPVWVFSPSSSSSSSSPPSPSSSLPFNFRRRSFFSRPRRSELRRVVPSFASFCSCRSHDRSLAVIRFVPLRLEAGEPNGEAAGDVVEEAVVVAKETPALSFARLPPPPPERI